MKNYAKVGLAALAVLIIVLILWFTGVFGGAEHNSRPGCGYTEPADWQSLGTDNDSAILNIYAVNISDMGIATLDESEYLVLGGNTAIKAAYLTAIQTYVTNFFASSAGGLGEPSNWGFQDMEEFFTPTSGGAPMTPSRFSDPNLSSAASSFSSNPATGCGQQTTWTSSATCAISGAANPGGPLPCQAPAGTVLNTAGDGYVCSSASADGQTRQRNTSPPNSGVTNTARANCGAVTGANPGGTTAPTGCVIVTNPADTACATMTAAMNGVAHPYRVVTNTSMPASRTTPVAASSLSDVGLTPSDGPIRGTVTSGLAGVNLLTASQAEIDANNLRAATTPTVYMCCQTIQYARDADTAANTTFTNNKATVLNGRQAEIDRLTALVARLGAMATEAAGALGNAQSSATAILATKYNHGFSNTGSIRA